MNLENYFNNNPDRLIHKWTHYFEIYEELFSRFKGKKINILEIGLFQGGSIQMWQKYFGEDGGHMMNQQILTFKHLYNLVKDDGIYLCEDVCTSYWSEYGGGYKNKSTFIEFSKQLIDKQNAFYSKTVLLKPDDFTYSNTSITFYDGIVAFHKKKRQKPKSLQKGKRFFEPEDDYKPEFLKKKTSLLDRFYKFYIKLRYFKS